MEQKPDCKGPNEQIVVVDVEAEGKPQETSFIIDKTASKEIVKAEPNGDFKVDKSVEVEVDDIIQAAIFNNPNSNQAQWNAQQNQQTYYSQGPYYQQQRIAGQPVYVQGYPPPQDASRMSPYRVRDMPSISSNVYAEDLLDVTFDSRSVRHNFIRKVYTLLTVQLMVTCGVILLCMYIEPVRIFVRMNFILAMIMLILSTIVLYMLSCYSEIRRKVPMNFFLLGLFTLFYSYVFAYISVAYPNIVVLASFGITAAVCLLISIFAMQTTCDITGWGIYLFIAMVVVSLFGLVALFVVLFTGIRIIFIIYAALIALLFSMYLMYDTQCIMGGRRQEISPEEYILGSVLLYVDIMQIFLAILTIFGYARS